MTLITWLHGGDSTERGRALVNQEAPLGIAWQGQRYRMLMTRLMLRICHKQSNVPNCCQIMFVIYASNKLCIQVLKICLFYFFQKKMCCPTLSNMNENVGQHAMDNLGPSSNEGNIRWPRELNALQLQKTHANRKSTSKSRKHFHHFDSRCCKCSQRKQIKKHAANAHNTTKYILFAARFFFGCVVSICSCVLSNWGSRFLNLQEFFLFAGCWALSATV